MHLLSRMRPRLDAAFARLRARMFPDPRRELVKALIADIQRQNGERTMMHVRLMDMLDDAARRRLQVD